MGGHVVRVFLSYRRDDVGGYTGRLADDLHERLGSKNVFQDVVAIAPGQDYTTVIDRALDESEVLLAIIGPGWLSAPNQQGSPRLFEADDYVRLELARALSRDVRVVPVLVGGAALPSAADLPDVLAGLTQRQAVVLHNETWHQDVEGLLRSLRSEPVAPGSPRRRPLFLAGAAVTLAALGAGAWWLWGPDNSGNSQGAGADLPACAPPDGDGWTKIARSKDPTGRTTPTTGGSLLFRVNDASWRAHGGQWQVSLAVSVENRSPDAIYDYDGRYPRLIVALRQSAPSCFSAEPALVDAGTAGDALIGFETKCKPVGHIQLMLEDDADRIDVTPSALGSDTCVRA